MIRRFLCVAGLVGFVVAVGVLAGCSAQQIKANLDAANAGAAEADSVLAAIEAERQGWLAELALLPDGHPAREPLLQKLEDAAGLTDTWANIHAQYTARAEQLQADLVTAGDDDVAATMYLGRSLAGVAAMFGIPGAGALAAVLGIFAGRRAGIRAEHAVRVQEHKDTAYALAAARAASPDFNAQFDGPVGGILRAQIPAAIAALGKQANVAAGVKAEVHP